MELASNYISTEHGLQKIMTNKSLYEKQITVSSMLSITSFSRWHA